MLGIFYWSNLQKETMKMKLKANNKSTANKKWQIRVEKCKKSFFVLEKIKKTPKVPSSDR